MSETQPDPSRRKRSFLGGLWRWTRRIAIAVAVFLLIGRATIGFWLPGVANRAVAPYDLHVSWDDLDLSILGLSLDLVGVRLVPLPESELDDEAHAEYLAKAQPLARLDDVGIDADVSALLFGDLRVHRIEIGGLETWVSRDAEGAWNFERHLPKADAADAKEQDAEDSAQDSAQDSADEGDGPGQDAESKEPEPLDFSSPVEISTVDLHGIRVHLNDALAQPTLDTVLDLQASLRDIGHPERPVQARVSARAEGVLDSILLEAKADLGVAKLLVSFDLGVDGVGLRTLAPYLALAGIEPSASKLNAHLGASVDLMPLGQQPEASPDPGAGADEDAIDLGGTITLETLTVDADGDVAVELLPTTIEVGRARQAAFELKSAVVSGLRAQATRLPGGAMRIAGLEFVGAPPSDDEAPPEEPGEEEEVDPDSASAPTSLRLDRLALEKVQLTFHDEALIEPQTLRANLAAEVRSIVLDAAEPGAPLSLSLSAGVDGAGTLGLEGTAVPTGKEIRADLALSGSDVTLASLEPYLETAGLTSTLKSGTLGGALQFRMVPGDTDLDPGASTRIDAAISELRFQDGETLHASLGGLELASMEITPGAGSTIERVALAGATIPIELFPGGAFRGFGLETLGLEPGLEGRSLGLSEGEIAVTDLAFGGAGSRATIAGSFDLTDIGDQIRLDGQVLTRAGPLDLEARVTLSGKNVSFDGLEEVLAAQGMEPDLENGELRLSADVTARAVEAVSPDVEGSTQVEARLFDVALVNRGVEVVAFDEVKVTHLETGADGTSIEAIDVVAPRVTLARDGAGVLLAAGLRIGVPKAAPEALDEEVIANAAEMAPTASEPVAPAPPVANGGGLVIDRITMEGLSAKWADASVTPAVETEFTALAEILGLDLSGGASAAPVQLHLEAALTGSMRSLNLDGTASLGHERQSAAATLVLEGLRAGPLAAYLPPSMEVTLADGRLSTEFKALMEPGADGGQAVRAEVTELDYRDGAEGEALLAFQSLLFEAARIDDEAAVYDVDGVTLQGLSFDAERAAHDRFEILGLALVAAPGGGAASKKPEPSPDEAGSEDPVPTAPSSAAPAPAPTQQLPPTVRLGRLDLGIDRLRYTDRTRADAIPLDLSLALVTPGPQVLCLPDPVELPPIEFSAVGAISPLVETLTLTTSLEPFAADPGGSFGLKIEGITGAQLARIDPQFAAMVDPSAYRNGSLTIEGDTRLSFARRGPLDFSLDRGFGATLNVETFALKETPEAEPTGFERLDIDVKRVSPETGDIRISSIDLSGVRARVLQSAEGMTVAGLLLPSPPRAEDAPAEEAVEEPSNSGTATAGDASPTDAAIGPEVAIDRLTVSGLDFEFLDTTVEPNFQLPITDLQLEVQRFTTRTLVERRPFSFRLVVDAGEIQLEERSGVDNLLFSVLSSAADAVTLQDDKFKMESRRVWDLMEASGRLSLGPAPRGRVQASLLGLELPAFRGPARAAGVEIGDGLLDNRTALRFREDGGLSLDTKTTTSYLSLSEPPDGPITRYLQLPAPLDTVLFLLRNDDGEQQIPIRLDIPAEGVSGGQIASLAASTLGKLITDAVSSAPLRVLGPLQNVAGALGLTSEPLTAETVTLEFTEGAATMASASVIHTADEPERGAEIVGGEDPLGDVIRALKGNPDLRVVVQAELGEGDLEVARRLANPPRESIESLIQYNRNRKAELERERSQLSAKARAQIFAGTGSGRAGTDASVGIDPVSTAAGRDEILARLQSLDAERATVEKALDELFQYIRPGAERRADARTRNAALALANQRLDRVRIALVQRVGNAVAQRIDVRRARYRKGTEKAPLPSLGLVTVTPK